MIIGSLDIRVEHTPSRERETSTGVVREVARYTFVAEGRPYGVSTPISQSQLRELGQYLVREADKSTEEK